MEPCLSHREIVDVLLQQQVISPNEIARNEIRIFDQEGRNPNTVVVRENKPDLFVKQFHRRSQMRECQTELTFYDFHQTRIVEQDEAAKIAPRCFFYSLEMGILILEYFGAPAETISANFSAENIQCSTAERLGNTVSAIQDLDLASERLPMEPPWIFKIGHPNLSDAMEMSSATIEIVGVIQRDIELLSAMFSMREAWVPEILNHGDLKWSNIVQLNPPCGTLVVLDWETASIGAKYWDVASLAAGFLLSWLLSIPATNSQEKDIAHTSAHHSLVDAMKCVHSLFAGFEETAVNQKPIGLQSRQVMQFVGMRLLQYCIELSQGHSLTTRNIGLVLQFARNCIVSNRAVLGTLYSDL